MTARFFIVFLYTHGLTTLTLSKMYVMMPSTRQKRHDNDKHDNDKHDNDKHDSDKAGLLRAVKDWVLFCPRTPLIKTVMRLFTSLVPHPRVPPGEKRSGERSRIPWAYYPKRVMTNEIARSVIIT